MKESAAPLKLLVVDDDAVDRMAVIRALGRIELPVEPTEAESVASARAALAEETFDVVVVDYNLPDGEGIDVLRAARSAPDPVPVIVLTGQGDEDLAVELMKEGARDYIPKAHLSPARLGQSLRHVVEVARAERETRRARHAQRFLVDVSAELALSLEYEATVERIPELAVPAMADYALLHLRESADRVRLAAGAHRDERLAERLRRKRSFGRDTHGRSPLFRTLESGEPALVAEVDEAWMKETAHDEEHLRLMREMAPRSVILVPLRARGKVLGSLAVAYSSSARQYDEQDVAVIQNLAARAALALDNARLYEEVRNEVELMDTLRRFGESITAELDMEAVVREMTERATELTGAEFGAFFQRTPDPDGEARFDLQYSTGPDRERLAAIGVGFSEAREVRREDVEGCVMTVPVVSEEEMVGGLLFGHPEPGAFDERDERVARGIASWAAVAIQNARLYRGAREATRARDDTLAVVSHDLRNPLNVIATSAALMLEIPLSEEKKRSQLEVIKRTTERMNRLIQDLLDVTTIEAGRLHIDRRPATAAELVQDACDSMEPLVAEEGIALVRQNRDPDVELLVDRERILQVFGNLIANAIRYTPEDGRICVGSQADADGARFWVEDTGPGIPLDQQEHLFDRFWRGEQQGATGTGLGLPIARGIVEMHGGTIEVDSEPGRGSRFLFNLPAGAAAPRTAPS